MPCFYLKPVETLSEQEMCFVSIVGKLPVSDQHFYKTVTFRKQKQMKLKSRFVKNKDSLAQVIMENIVSKSFQNQWQKLGVTNKNIYITFRSQPACSGSHNK